MYAVLAAMYTAISINTAGLLEGMTPSAVSSGSEKYRSGADSLVQSVFERSTAFDLCSHRLISEDLIIRKPNATYALSRKGLQTCFKLFQVRYTPPQYAAVNLPHGIQLLEDGIISQCSLGYEEDKFLTYGLDKIHRQCAHRLEWDNLTLPQSQSVDSLVESRSRPPKAEHFSNHTKIENIPHPLSHESHNFAHSIDGIDLEEFDADIEEQTKLLEFFASKRRITDHHINPPPSKLPHRDISNAHHSCIPYSSSGSSSSSSSYFGEPHSVSSPSPALPVKITKPIKESSSAHHSISFIDLTKDDLNDNSIEASPPKKIQRVNAQGQLANSSKPPFSSPPQSSVTVKTLESAVKPANHNYEPIELMPRSHYQLQSSPPATSAYAFILLDDRERGKQTYFREFFTDILRDRLKTSAGTGTSADKEIVPVPSAALTKKQQKEMLGKAKLTPPAFSLAYQVHVPMGDFIICMGSKANNSSWVSNCVIERKTLNDIVSRSAGTEKSYHYDSLEEKWRDKTGPHMKQERKLRQSGLCDCFMLIEGILSENAFQGLCPKVRDVNGLELENPDVIIRLQDLRSYIGSVLARNYSKDRQVRCLLTPNIQATGQLFKALLLAEEFHFMIGDAATRLLPEWESFASHCNAWGGVNQGREHALRRRLHENNIHSEMAERIVRRFGDWDSLLYLYKICIRNHSDSSVELRCSLLLAELEVAGTQTQCKAITENTKAFNAFFESRKVWETVKETLKTSTSYNDISSLNPDTVIPLASLAHQHCNKKSVIRMSKCMSKRLQSLQANIQSAFSFEPDEDSPFSSTTSKETTVYANARIHCESKLHTNKLEIVRKSYNHCIVVVPGMDVIEAIVLALTDYQRFGGDASRNYRDCEIAYYALKSIESLRFPSFFGEFTDQRIVLIEGLANGANSGAFYQLAKLIKTAQSENIQRQRLNAFSFHDVTSSEDKDEIILQDRNPETRLPLNVARAVSDSANEWPSTILAVASVVLKWQCILTKNAEETLLFVGSLIDQVHQQSLLIK